MRLYPGLSETLERFWFSSVGIVSIVATPIAAFVRRPSVQVRETVWVARDPVQWHFATVAIRNAPPPR